MTHFKVDIQLPKVYNEKEGTRIQIPEESFTKTYDDLLSIVGGISLSKNPILGSWIHPSTGERFDDETITYSVLVNSEDRRNPQNATKIKELIDYKKTLMIRFKQHEIFMVTSRCTWL